MEQTGGAVEPEAVDNALQLVAAEVGETQARPLAGEGGGDPAAKDPGGAGDNDALVLECASVIHDEVSLSLLSDAAKAGLMFPGSAAGRCSAPAGEQPVRRSRAAVKDGRGPPPDGHFGVGRG